MLAGKVRNFFWSALDALTVCCHVCSGIHQGVRLRAADFQVQRHQGAFPGAVHRTSRTLDLDLRSLCCEVHAAVTSPCYASGQHPEWAFALWCTLRILRVDRSPPTWRASKVSGAALPSLLPLECSAAAVPMYHTSLAAVLWFGGYLSRRALACCWLGTPGIDLSEGIACAGAGVGGNHVAECASQLSVPGLLRGHEARVGPAAGHQDHRAVPA